MKKLLLLCFLNVSAHASTECWGFYTKIASYSIKIQYEGNNISGSYCFINANGNRIDCDDGISNISGKKIKGVGFISFHDKEGKASLIEKNNQMELEILDSKPFDDFNMAIPKIIYLNKEKCQ